MTDASSPPGARPFDELFARVYGELKALAHQVRGGRAGETLNTTALVHEAFIKLANARSVLWKDEAHFFSVAARAMRQIVVDTARRHVAQKRGGGDQMVSFNDAEHAAPLRAEELLSLDTALERLAAVDPRRAQVVEHRIFAGITTDETAKLMGLSTATVERDWRVARAWLAAEMAARGDADSMA
jgi:RNA polymerase sigma factor (TIGR02999 family)